MKQRPRIYYTESQKSLMWESWQKGESLQQIAQLFDRNHSSNERILAETGGIRPARRCRSRLALTFAEREHISRAVVAGRRRRALAFNKKTKQSRSNANKNPGVMPAVVINASPSLLNRLSSPMVASWRRVRIVSCIRQDQFYPIVQFFQNFRICRLISLEHKTVNNTGVTTKLFSCIKDSRSGRTNGRSLYNGKPCISYALAVPGDLLGLVPASLDSHVGMPHR
jgi:hypothetical protein